MFSGLLQLIYRYSYQLIGYNNLEVPYFSITAARISNISSISMLSTLCLGFYSGFFPSGFPPQICVNHSSLPHMPCAPCLSCPEFHSPNNIWRGLEIINLLTRFSKPRDAFSFAGPNNPNTLFSETPSVYNLP